MTTKKVGERLSYDQKAILGRGTFGTVFNGFLEILAVAVKRIQNSEPEAPFIHREVELMQKAKEHPNILRYICTERDNRFMYVVTELCKGTLEDYVKGKYQGPKFPSEADILLQVTQGLDHLHSLNIVHRDIKPNNILIFVPDGDGAEPQMKLADFGISKGLHAGRDDFTNTSVTNPNGTRGWMAPEVYQHKRFDFKVDIFPLGCIFAYTLSGGKHPFGDDPDQRLVRIKDQQPMLMVQQDLISPYYSEDSEGFEVIKSMLEMDPSKRPTAREVLDVAFLKMFSVMGRTKQLIGICLSLESMRSENDYDSAHQQLKYLLSYGKVNANMRGNYGKTPLHYLCENYKNDNLIDILNLLIQNGVDLNVKDSFARTPLHHLCGNYKNDNLIDILNLFIQNGVDLNVKNKLSRTPLHYLCQNYKNDNFIDILNLFIQNGVDLNVKDSFARTPLHFLCENYKNDNFIDILNLFIQNGVDLNVKDSFARAPLHFLCENYKNDNLIDILNLFIQNGVDLNGKDRLSRTPVHFLSGNYKKDNLIDILNLLIKNGVDLNVKDSLAWTPLHYLCENYKNDNLFDILNLLIQNGADLNAKDRREQTPLILLRNRRDSNANQKFKDLVNIIIENVIDSDMI